MSRNYKSVASKLLTAARYAHTELFALMLSEAAHKVDGRYTDAYRRLDKAIQEAEAALKDEES